MRGYSVIKEQVSTGFSLVIAKQLHMYFPVERYPWPTHLMSIYKIMPNVYIQKSADQSNLIQTFD